MRAAQSAGPVDRDGPGLEVLEYGAGFRTGTTIIVVPMAAEDEIHLVTYPPPRSGGGRHRRRQEQHLRGQAEDAEHRPASFLGLLAGEVPEVLRRHRRIIIALGPKSLNANVHRGWGAPAPFLRAHPYVGEEDGREDGDAIPGSKRGHDAADRANARRHREGRRRTSRRGGAAVAPRQGARYVKVAQDVAGGGGGRGSAASFFFVVVARLVA